MCILSIKVPIRKKSGNLFIDPRNLILFGPFIGPNQVLQSSVNLGEMAMKGYPYSPKLQHY